MSHALSQETSSPSPKRGRRADTAPAPTFVLFQVKPDVPAYIQDDIHHVALAVAGAVGERRTSLIKKLLDFFPAIYWPVARSHLSPAQVSIRTSATRSGTVWSISIPSGIVPLVRHHIPPGSSRFYPVRNTRPGDIIASADLSCLHIVLEGGLFRIDRPNTSPAVRSGSQKV